MRRALVSALAVPALLLAGCSDDGEVVETPTPSASVDAAPATESADDEQTSVLADDAATSTSDAATSSDDAVAATSDDAVAATSNDAASTGDAAGSTADGEVEGGEDGQAAADTAKAFFVSMVKAEPEACDHLLSFTDTEKPMKDVESDYELCQEILPTVLQKEVESQGLDEEGAAILEAMKITGADVTGDTAVVDEDNFSQLFADAMGGEAMTLKKIEGQWYIDLDNSFQGAGR